MQPFIASLSHVINLVDYTFWGDNTGIRILFILASDTFGFEYVAD